MALTSSEIEGLRRIAGERGVNPDDFVRAAEEADAGDAATTASTAGAAPAAGSDATKLPQIFMWHKPFVRVRELRARLGFDERIEDDDMTCAIFEARHGGAAGASAPRTDAPAPDETAS